MTPLVAALDAVLAEMATIITAFPDETHMPDGLYRRLDEEIYDRTWGGLLDETRRGNDARDEAPGGVPDHASLFLEEALETVLAPTTAEARAELVQALAVGLRWLSDIESRSTK